MTPEFINSQTGEVFFISEGIAPGSGLWGVYRRAPGARGSHRVKSPALAPTQDQAALVAALRKYAQLRGYVEVGG